MADVPPIAPGTKEFERAPVLVRPFLVSAVESGETGDIEQFAARTAVLLRASAPGRGFGERAERFLRDYLGCEAAASEEAAGLRARLRVLYCPFWRLEFKPRGLDCSRVCTAMLSALLWGDGVEPVALQGFPAGHRACEFSLLKAKGPIPGLQMPSAIEATTPQGLTSLLLQLSPLFGDLLRERGPRNLGLDETLHRLEEFYRCLGCTAEGRRENGHATLTVRSCPLRRLKPGGGETPYCAALREAVVDYISDGVEVEEARDLPDRCEIVLRKG